MSAEVKQARDLLLVARANREAAKKAFQEACGGMFFEASDGRELKKFNREKVEAEYDCGNLIIAPEVYWALTEDYLRHCPEAKKYCDDPKSHPDFAAMISAKLALREANKQHGIAYRRLLTIGVKRGAK